MAGITFDLQVQVDGDPEPYNVTVDQRDVAAWELEPFGCAVYQYPSKMYTFSRYIAWHHAKRTGKTKKNFSNWSDGVIWVNIVRDDDDDPDDAAPPAAADPGVTAPSAVTS